MLAGSVSSFEIPCCRLMCDSCHFLSLISSSSVFESLLCIETLISCSALNFLNFSSFNQIKYSLFGPQNHFLMRNYFLFRIDFPRDRIRLLQDLVSSFVCFPLRFYLCFCVLFILIDFVLFSKCFYLLYFLIMGNYLKFMIG